MSWQGAAERSAPSSRGAPSSQTVPITYRGEMAPLVHERLVKALGGKRAAEVMRDALTTLGDHPLDTPADLLVIAEVMIRSGGLVQAVGRTLKVQALLRGAVER